MNKNQGSIVVKKISLIIAMTVSLYSTEYFSKVEPLQEYVLKSNVSGRVVTSQIMKEKNILSKDQVIIKIDTEIDEIELSYLEKRLEIIEELLKIKEKDAKAIEASVAKSEIEKRNSRQTYLNAKLTKYDVQRTIKKLKTTIKRKTITLKAKTYLDEIKVVKDDYVMPGTVLLTYSDINKVKLKVYVKKTDYENINTKNIYINGKHYPQYKITKKALTKDKDKMSMFEIELMGIQNGFMFGDIVKVEFK